jgi:hypothetical protein
MAYAIGIIDYVPGKTRAFVSSLELSHEVVKVRDLIRKRIEVEAGQLMQRDYERPPTLVIPDWDEMQLNGREAPPPQPIDVPAQTRMALEGFSKAAFLLIVNGRQVESLDEEVAVSQNATATFIRLVPLVGG